MLFGILDDLELEHITFFSSLTFVLQPTWMANIGHLLALLSPYSFR